MPPKPLDIKPTSSLSERYYVEQSPTNSEFVSSPPDTRFAPYLGSDSSDTNLVSSSSEGFKSPDDSPRRGLPSYYRARNDGVVEATISDANESRTTSRTNPIWRNWRRHLLGWRLVLFDSCMSAIVDGLFELIRTGCRAQSLADYDTHCLDYPTGLGRLLCISLLMWVASPNRFLWLTNLPQSAS
jgi:hypothetical protein